jgi:signal peptidase I
LSSPEDPPASDPPESPALGEPALGEATASRREEWAPPSEPTEDRRVLRLLFRTFWLGAVPLALAVGNVWLLTPSSALPSDGGLRVFVADQPIPTGIVLFTLFAMLVWRFRHDLPFAAAVGEGGRRDLPAVVRGRFEDAGALLEEARNILRAYRREVERELTSAEREHVQQALTTLERAMYGGRFDAQTFDAAHARADRVVGEHLSRWRKGEMREYAESIGIAVAVALLLRAFVVEAFKIPSGSMIPTLMIGDHIFVNKFTYGPLVPWTDKRLFSRLPPSRADVMVFKFPENKDQDFIKRVIAVPGDTLEAINGRPVINGWLVPHCYVGPFRYENRTAELFVEFLGEKSYFTLFDISPDEQTCTKDECGPGLTCRGGICGSLQGPFKVAPEEVWVMGDNRNNSHDSRSWRGGLGAGVPFENIKGRAMFVWMSFGPGGGIEQDRLFVNVLGRPKLPAAQEPTLGKAVDKCLRERPSIAQSTPPSSPSKR